MLSAIALVLLAIQTALIWQGWQTRPAPEVDQLVNIGEISKVIELRGLPEKGALSSLLSYNPPGTSWLLLPGMLLGDVRLFEMPGAFLGTLAGVACFLAFAYCGVPSAVVIAAIVIFLLGDPGIFQAGSVWPRSPAWATLWCSFFAWRWWVAKRDRDLCLALVMMNCSLFVFLESAPFVSGLLLVLIAGKAWKSRRPIIAALCVGVVIWLPYLNFQYHRGFRDLYSQLFVKHLDPFSARIEPGINFGFKLLPSNDPAILDSNTTELHRFVDGVVHNVTDSFDKLSVEDYAKCAVLWGVIIAFGVSFLRKWRRSPPPSSETSATAFVAFLVLSCGLILLAFRTDHRRFIHLWGVESLLLASGAFELAKRYRFRRFGAEYWPLIVCAVIYGFLSDSFIARIRIWEQGAVHPAGGPYDAYEVIRDEARRSAGSQLGFQVCLQPWQLTHAAVDFRYRPSARYEFLATWLELPVTTVPSLRGVDKNDSIRLVQHGTWHHAEIFAFPAQLDEFECIFTDRVWQVWRRKEPRGVNSSTPSN
jgi:hypothetical protein